GESHVGEARELLARSLERGAGEPRAQTTSRGVAGAATPAPDGMPLWHVSLSLGEGAHDTELLCDLTGRVCPGAVADSAVLTDASVLHVLVADISGEGTDPRAAGRALFGQVARQLQAEAGAEVATRAAPDSLAPERAAYFGG